MIEERRQYLYEKRRKQEEIRQLEAAGHVFHCVMGHALRRHGASCKECKAYKRRVADQWFSAAADRLPQNERDALHMEYLLTKNL